MFRVVPAGKQFMMRTELKSVAIINDDIVAVSTVDISGFQTY